jgi:hypothetical protein
MREVSPGLALERFMLVTRGDVYCVVDVVDDENASVTLTALPGFPLEIQGEKARRLVAAWQQRANLESESYEVRQEHREL